MYVEEVVVSKYLISLMAFFLASISLISSATFMAIWNKNLSNCCWTYLTFHVYGFSTDFWEVVGWVVAWANGVALWHHWLWIHSSINSLSSIIQRSSLFQTTIEIKMSFWNMRFDDSSIEIRLKFWVLPSNSSEFSKASLLSPVSHKCALSVGGELIERCFNAAWHIWILYNKI